MVLTLVTIGVLVAVVVLSWWVRRDRGRRLLEAQTIGPEQLHDLLEHNKTLKLYDVRVPLDVLASSEMIPGAVRVAPKEILADPSLIPQDEETVVYCTCPGDETARTILQRATGMGFARVRLLRGGLAGWKAKGYPVEPYQQVFHLDTPA